MIEHADPADQSQGGLLLVGLDGANPLGFLAALGTLQTLAMSHSQRVTMSWSRHESTWAAVLHGVGQCEHSVAAQLHKHMQCGFTPDGGAEAERGRTRKAFEAKKTELSNALKGLKKRALRREARKEAERREVEPLKQELGRLRSAWLQALQRCVPSLELALEKHLNAACDELREAMSIGLDHANRLNRKCIDLYSSFGSDACHVQKSDAMQATPFCFITGSGHQYFLDTVRQLVEKVKAPQIEKALFGQAKPQDEKLSMRWAPQEDRRHAVMWDDPTATGNEPRTNWALNLLAYHGLQLLPSVPLARGLSSTGWVDDEGEGWNWPIWTGRLTASVIRSLLSHPSLVRRPPNRSEIGSLGISAVYRSLRIQVGAPPLHKINFTPAMRIG